MLTNKIVTPRMSETPNKVAVFPVAIQFNVHVLFRFSVKPQHRNFSYCVPTQKQ